MKYLFEHRFSVQHIMYLLTQWKSCTGNSLAQGLNRGLYVMNESQTFSPPARSPLFFFLSFSLQPTYRRAARAYPFLHGFILSCTGLSFPARVYPSLHGFILPCTCLSFPARVYPSLHTPSGIIQMCFRSSVRGGRTGHMIKPGDNQKADIDEKKP